jgi:hypothetical protein
MIKRFILAAALCAAFAAFTLAAEKTWTGWVSCTMCGAKGANADHAACAKKCVEEHGAKYALVTDSDKKVYVLDPQATVAEHAGHHVAVKGSLEGDTIRVTSVEMVK